MVGAMRLIASRTESGWVAHALAHFDEVLVDHAHLERKAAGTAVRLLFQYPDRLALQAPLAALAREELAHFEEVLAQLARRGVAFGRQQPSQYAGRLRAAARSRDPERLVDTLLFCALIESRSCERLGLLAEALPDPELARFYAGLERAEARHQNVYVELAETVAPRDAVRARLAELAKHEAEVVAALPRAARLHS
jgi:tRNA 2-(methylsulfanyl)-N6-isopentenyladenosine37 hydroxylase